MTVQSAGTWDFRPVVDAAGVLIDAAGFKVNAYLMPYVDQLSPHVARNLERGARLRRPAVADAERAREAVRERFASLLEDFPVLVMPTLIGQPPLFGHRGIMLTLLTAPVNLAGLPALSLPVPARRRRDRVAAGDRRIGGAGAGVRQGGRDSAGGGFRLKTAGGTPQW